MGENAKIMVQISYREPGRGSTASRLRAKRRNGAMLKRKERPRAPATGIRKVNTLHDVKKLGQEEKNQNKPTTPPHQKNPHQKKKEGDQDKRARGYAAKPSLRIV